MRVSLAYQLAACLFISFAAVSCSREPNTRSRDYPPPASSAAGDVLAPHDDDGGDELVSWVDGEPIANWRNEIEKRDKAIEAYLNDSDAAHAAKYGFRDGQNPRLAWDWFRNNPVGFNGLPYVLFKTILDLDPNHSDPVLRKIARVWKREATVPYGTGAPAEQWTLDHLGVEPRPESYQNGVATAPAAHPGTLPFGFAFENPHRFAPLSSTELAAYDARLRARRVFTNTSLLVAKLHTADKEENWEQDRSGFGSPGSMDRVFFSCAACHVGRVVVNGKMKFLPGMPNTEIEAQYYSKLLMLTSAALVESGFDPTSSAPVNPAGIKPNTAA